MRMMACRGRTYILINIEAMKIGMIGAGNLATHLAPALRMAGHDVVGVFSRTHASAAALADRVGAPVARNVEDLAEADAYVMSVSDDALKPLAQRLCPLHGNALFIHTAGSVPLAVFEGLAVRYGVLYPMQTFTKSRHVDFRHIPCFVEGNTPEVSAGLQVLAGQISDMVIPLDSDRRRLLHLAAVFACNFVNHCYAEASLLAAQAGIPFHVLLPLIDETAAKVHELTPQEAQTGPAVRYDRGVMQRQEALLADPVCQTVYRALSARIHACAAVRDTAQPRGEHPLELPTDTSL